MALCGGKDMMALEIRSALNFVQRHFRAGVLRQTWHRCQLQGIPRKPECLQGLGFLHTLESSAETVRVNDIGLRPLRPSSLQRHHSGSTWPLEPAFSNAGNLAQSICGTSRVSNGGTEAVQDCSQAEAPEGESKELQELEIEKVEVGLSSYWSYILHPQGEVCLLHKAISKSLRLRLLGLVVH